MGLMEQINLEIEKMEQEGAYSETKQYCQHGNTTIYEHCVNVAYVSCQIAERLRLRVDKKSLIRGALLHDYFLYDWHEKDRSHRLHGFRHSRTALRNAENEYSLNEIEKNIIVCHMFPLTIIPPCTKEAWIVCIADKWSAAMEIRWVLWLRGRICDFVRSVCGSVNKFVFLEINDSFWDEHPGHP